MKPSQSSLLLENNAQNISSSLKVFASAPLNYFANAPQIPKFNTTSLQLPKTIQARFLWLFRNSFQSLARIGPKILVVASLNANFD